MIVTVEIKNHIPYRNQCLTPKVIYEATVVNNSDDEKRAYIGTSDKTRDFNHERYSKCTDLSKFIWQLKRNKKIPNIEWKIVKKIDL